MLSSILAHSDRILLFFSRFVQNLPGRTQRAPSKRSPHTGWQRLHLPTKSLPAFSYGHPHFFLIMGRAHWNSCASSIAENHKRKRGFRGFFVPKRQNSAPCAVRDGSGGAVIAVQGMLRGSVCRQIVHGLAQACLIFCGGLHEGAVEQILEQVLHLGGVRVDADVLQGQGHVHAAHEITEGCHLLRMAVEGQLQAVADGHDLAVQVGLCLLGEVGAHQLVGLVTQSGSRR